MNKRSVVFITCICFYLAGVVCFSVYFFNRDRGNAFEVMDQRLAAGAAATSDILGRSYHNDVFNREVSDEDYLEKVKALSHMAETAGLTYVYSMVEKDGKVFFTCSSATPEEQAKNEYTSFLDEYPEASQTIRTVFATGKTAFDETADKWGTFRSILIPMTSADGTKYVVGADISMSDLAGIERASLYRSLLSGLAFVVFIAPLIFVMLRFAREDKLSLEARIVEATAEVRTLNSSLEAQVRAAQDQADKAREAMLQAEEAKGQAIAARRQGMTHAADLLQDVAEVVSTTSSQLMVQVHRSSDGAQDQAERIGQTSRAMEELGAMVGRVTSSANEASGISEQARGKASDGAAVVGRMASEIAGAERQVVGLKSDMAALGEQARNIGKILGVISDIADQTNLLALNAAIEAARAGEAGRGFAVVADEVRKLAEKTMTATKQVSEAIAGIQDNTGKSVRSVETTVESIGRAAALGAESGQALGDIVQIAAQASERIAAIAALAGEQARANAGIVRIVGEVSAISGDTARNMEEASRAVQALVSRAEALNGVIRDLRSDDCKAC